MASIVKADVWQNGAGVNYNNIVQVVSVENTQQLALSTGTANIWTNTGTQATITPKFSTSKILILVQQSYFHENTGAQGMGFRIYKNGVGLTTENGFTASYMNANRRHGYTPITYVDSPSTSSAITYSIWVQIWATGGTAQLQYGNNESPSRIVLMEIAQ